MVIIELLAWNKVQFTAIFKIVPWLRPLVVKFNIGQCLSKVKDENVS